MSDLVPSGVELFVKNLNSFLSGIGEASRAIGTLNETAESSEGGADTLAGAFGNMLSESRQLGPALAVIETVISAIGVAAAAAVAAIAAVVLILAAAAVNATAAAVALGGFLAQCAQARSEVDQLTLSASYLANQAGETSTKIDAANEALQNVGATSTQSAKAISSLSANGISLANSADLFGMALGGAAVTGKNANAVLDELAKAISSGNTESLKQYGIFLDSNAALQQYAAGMGKTIENLTEAEKKQVLLNAVLQRGSALQEAYAASMEMPGAQLQRISEDIIPEIISQIGGPFQSAFGTITSSLLSFSNMILRAVSEGGALHPILMDLGVAAQFAANGFSFIVKIVEKYLLPMVTVMYNWGKNIIAQLAQGMFDAIIYVIDALAAVGRVISEWLSPGSPPKLLPDIDKWGESAMGYFLDGFGHYVTRQGAKIFNDLAGTLERHIRNTVGKATDALRAILNVRDVLGSAFGAMPEDINESWIDSVIGGLSMVDDAARQFARAFLIAKDAEQEVARAQAEVNRLTKEYNDLLQPIEDNISDLSDAQADLMGLTRMSQLELVANDPNATLLEKELARLEIEKLIQEQARRGIAQEKRGALQAANAVLDEAKAKEEAAKQELEFRKSLLDMQDEQVKLLKELKDAIKGIGGGIKIKMPELKTPSFEDWKLPDFGAGITESFDKATYQLQVKLEEIKQSLNELGEAWETPFTTARDVILNLIGIAIAPLLLGLLTLNGSAQTAKATFGFLTETFALLWDKLTVDIIPTFTALETLFRGALYTALINLDAFLRNTFYGALQLVWGFVVNSVQVAFENLKKFWDEDLSAAIDDLKEKIQTFVDDVLAGLDTFSGRAASAISSVVSEIDKLIKKIASVVIPWWWQGGSPSPWETWTVNIGKAVQKLSRVQLPALKVAMDRMAPVSAVSSTVNRNISAVRNFNLSVNSQQPSAGVVNDFALMELLT